MPRSTALDFDPSLRARGFEDGVADELGAEGVAEVGVVAGRGWIREGLHELRECVDEGMFITEAETGDPPLSCVRMIAIGGVDAAPASAIA